MKFSLVWLLVPAVLVSGAVIAHSGDMKDKDMSECMQMMGMDMGNHKGMNMGKGGMMGKGSLEKSAALFHAGSGVVKKIDAANRTVTIAHGPVKTLDWSAMTMAFDVRDKSLLNKLQVDKKVDFEFVQVGSEYVITAAD